MEGLPHQCPYFTRWGTESDGKGLLCVLRVPPSSWTSSNILIFTGLTLNSGETKVSDRESRRWQQQTTSYMFIYVNYNLLTLMNKRKALLVPQLTKNVDLPLLSFRLRRGDQWMGEEYDENHTTEVPLHVGCRFCQRDPRSLSQSGETNGRRRSRSSGSYIKYILFSYRV